MPAALGQLVVSLSANIAEFTGAMSRAAYISNKRMLEIEQAAKRAGAVIGAAMVVGAGALALAVKSAVDSMDDLSKTAQKVGVSVETLSGWQHAAELSDVSNQQLSTGLRMLAKNMADTAMGTGEAKDAFKALGIQVVNNNGTLKSSEEVFREVADRFGGMEDGAAKTALAMRVFGKAGGDLIPMLNSGSQGLADMTEEARQFGLIVSGDAAAAAESFNDNLTRMKTQATALGIAIATDLLPTLNQLTEEFLAATKAGGGFFEGLKIWSTTSGAEMADPLGQVGVLYKRLAELKTLRADLSKDTLANKLNDIVFGDVGDLDRQIAYTEKKLKFFLEMTSGADGGSVVSKPKTKGTVGPTKEDEAAAKEFARQQKRLRDDDIKGWVAHADAVFAAADEQNREMAKISEAYWKKEDENRAKSMQGWYDWIDQEQEAAIKEGEELLAISEANSKKAADAAAEFGFTMSSAFEDAVIEGKKFRDVLAGVAEDIARMILRQSVTTPLKNAVVGMFSGDGIFANIFGGGRASGGSVKAGSSYLVGEFGPEVVTMGGNGHVTPNAKLGGDTNVSITVNSDGSSRSESGDGRNMELGRRLEAAVRGVLVAEKRPGGLLAGA